MPNKTFKLKGDQEFIQLNNLLQVLQLVQTGGHAKIVIQNKEVKVNGEIETRVRKKIRKDDLVQIEGYRIKVV